MAGDIYEISFKVAKGNLGLESHTVDSLYETWRVCKADYRNRCRRRCDVPIHSASDFSSYDSVFEATNTINIAKTSRVIWGEVITCGRKLYGEAGKCSSLINCQTIQEFILTEN